jgi:hypothetical protein
MLGYEDGPADEEEELSVSVLELGPPPPPVAPEPPMGSVETLAAAFVLMAQSLQGHRPARGGVG